MCYFIVANSKTKKNLTQFQGYGFYQSRGVIYEGSFESNSRHGEGTLLNPNGKLEYHGEWKKGQRNGKGIKCYEDGSEYIGEFKNDLKHGNGKEKYSNEDEYEGSFKNNQRHGWGTYKWKNGCKYIGNYSKGFRHGKGTYYSNDGRIYEGEYFFDGVKSVRYGKGILTYSKGKRLSKVIVNSISKHQ